MLPFFYSWHSVTFSHIGKTIVVELDGQRYEQDELDGDSSFHFGGKALIGGGENMNGLPGKHVNSSLYLIKDCMLKVNAQHLLPELAASHLCNSKSSHKSSLCKSKSCHKSIHLVTSQVTIHLVASLCAQVQVKLQLFCPAVISNQGHRIANTLYSIIS